MGDSGDIGRSFPGTPERLWEAARRTELAAETTEALANEMADDLSLTTDEFEDEDSADRGFATTRAIRNAQASLARDIRGHAGKLDELAATLRAESHRRAQSSAPEGKGRLVTPESADEP